MRGTDLFGSRHGGSARAGRSGRGRGALRPAVALTLFACGGLLALSQIEPAVVAPVRSAAARVLTPVASAAADAAGIALAPARVAIAWMSGSGTSSQGMAGRPEYEALQARIAALERENRDLKALSSYAEGNKPGLISARVVMRSSSPLSQTAVLDAGSAQGVREGWPVMAGARLIGRVVQSYEDQASIMLLTDRLSRVPVSVGAGEVRAVLVGTGETGARLEFLSPGAAIAAGDLVTTSGIGGMFPRGLTVGVVAHAADAPDVRLPAADDDPLVAGVLPMEGAAYEAVTTVSTRARKTLGQAGDARDQPLPKAGQRAGGARHD